MRQVFKVEKSSKSQIPIILKLYLSIICLLYLLLYLFIYLLVRPQRKVPTTYRIGFLICILPRNLVTMEMSKIPSSVILLMKKKTTNK